MDSNKARDPNEPWIQLHSGKPFFFLDPGAEDIDIKDIAYGLSAEPRFAGQSKRSEDGYVYSVAQHCYLASYLIGAIISCESSDLAIKKFSLTMLLHDAAEGYIKDIPTPIKKVITGYKEIENRIIQTIFNKFGIEEYYPFPPMINQVDAIMLATERRDLMQVPDIPWGYSEQIKPADIKIVPMSPETSRKLFLRRFHELTV